MEPDKHREKHKAKARMLKALADRGVGGEKTNAKKKLEEHLKKHNMTMSDIDSSLNNRRIRIKNEDDMFILVNVILSVNPFAVVTHMGKCADVNLDDEDFMEVREKFRYFIKLYRNERNVFNMGFMHKHKEHLTPDEDVRKKWREKYTVNEDLVSAQLKADKINNQLSDSKKKKLDAEFMAEMERLDRMAKYAGCMKEAKYVRVKRTIESQ